MCIRDRARKLLEHETIDGQEVERLIRVAGGDRAPMPTTGNFPSAPATPDMSSLPSTEPTFDPTQRFSE